MPREFSPQQLAVFAHVSAAHQSALLKAVAGAGKTTTLVEAASRMKGYVTMTAFNKAIAGELKARLPQRQGMTAGTFHSFGFGALLKGVKTAFGKANPKKVVTLAVQRKVPSPNVAFLGELVSLAKQRAVGVLTPDGDTRPWYDIIEHFGLTEKLSGDADVWPLDQLVGEAQELLRLSNALIKQGQIDFDDMIYGPLVLNLPMWQNHWLLVDECQDTNPARRALARKMMRPDGLSLWVGDPCQAIYGFTGADNDSCDIIMREFGCVELPLTVTYRCPKAVVTIARQWVPYIEAAPTSAEGTATTISRGTFDQMAPKMLKADDAVLCRLTKPLVELAYQLIGANIACHVEGKEIGEGLVKLVEKVACAPGLELNAFLDRLAAWQTKEQERLIAKGQETAAENVGDKCDCIRVIEERLPASATTRDLVAAIENLFSDTPDGQPARTLTLSTVHKAKGREWDRVYLLGRNKFMPSKWARQDWQYQQELNLMYVAVTRAKQSLIDVEV